MNLLARIGYAIVVFIIVTVALLVFGTILKAIPTEATVRVGALLQDISGWLGLLAALAYGFLGGDRWTTPRRR